MAQTQARKRPHAKEIMCIGRLVEELENKLLQLKGEKGGIAVNEVKTVITVTARDIIVKSGDLTISLQGDAVRNLGTYFYFIDFQKKLWKEAEIVATEEGKTDPQLFLERARKIALGYYPKEKEKEEPSINGYVPVPV